MIELAKAKRWTSLCFTGTDAFKTQGMAAALQAGIDVVLREERDESLLAKILAARRPGAS